MTYNHTQIHIFEKYYTWIKKICNVYEALLENRHFNNFLCNGIQQNSCLPVKYLHSKSKNLYDY